jgi:multimeric flavodoxin WrbA/putative sterol carrier protein
MSPEYTVVAVNGSPHVGMGNTARMIGMLREILAGEGFELEEIFLSQHHIEPCTGCALCLEKGACWVRDDYQDVARKVFDADAVILASPVYVFNVTAQMKAFLDRSLGYGHRPREGWKPGLAVSVSAGYGETAVVEYLGRVLRIFGAFPVGLFTAIAVRPGEFLGLAAVKARAQDLARDLARAVREGRRYPATDQDLHFWHFMGHLIKEHREFLQADDEHWRKLGFYDSFEAYVKQTRTPAQGSPEMREAWMKNLMTRQQERGAASRPAPPEPSPLEARSARELLQAMPRALNRDAARGLTAAYQFDISGAEEFTAHLVIENGSASYCNGPADKPDVIIKAPAEVWLAIARGEKNGAQAFMAGEYRVEGDLELLVKLKDLFPI